MSPRKKQYSMDLREAIIDAKKAARTDWNVATQFKLSHTAVSRLFKKFKATASVERKAGSGRPRKSTERLDRAMVRIVKEDPKKTAVDLMKYVREHLGLDIGVHTIRRRLNSAELFARRPAKKPLISEKNRRARLAFARRHQHWTKDDWAKMLWSNNKFNLFSSDSIRYVRRLVGERFNPK